MNFKIAIYTILIIGIVGLVFLLNKNDADKPVVAMSKSNYEKQTCTIDSLKVVTDSLQREIFMLEDGFDDKEHRYEDVISDYEMGISYLKYYHSNAYKDFHRIIGMKEKYSEKLQRENTKRLKIVD